MDKTETGKDGVLIVDGEEIPFTNATPDISFGTSEATHNDELNNKTAHTDKSVTLTIEVDGSSAELKAKVMDENGNPRQDIRAEITGSEGGDRFTEGKPTSFNREYPGGDITTTEIEVTFDNHRPLDLGA
jgi:hypothetical protein